MPVKAAQISTVDEALAYLTAAIQAAAKRCPSMRAQYFNLQAQLLAGSAMPGFKEAFRVGQSVPGTINSRHRFLERLRVIDKKCGAVYTARQADKAAEQPPPSPPPAKPAPPIDLQTGNGNGAKKAGFPWAVALLLGAGTWWAVRSWKK